MKEVKITIKVLVYEVGDTFSEYKEKPCQKGNVIEFNYNYHRIKAVCVDCKFSGFEDYWKCTYKVLEVLENANRYKKREAVGRTTNIILKTE